MAKAELQPRFVVLPALASTDSAALALPAGAGVTITARGLAQALAGSPYWSEIGDAVIIFRPAPAPLIGVAGYFDRGAETRINALGNQLNDSLGRLRYIDYATAEAACARLAEVLRAYLGANKERAVFVAIPRGGLMVLGILSYLLDLRPEQLAGPAAPLSSSESGPIVVVDDCAITGARFRAFLPRLPAGDIVFAPLYSHPALRATIIQQEPLVVGCVSAHDLQDHAPRLLGDELETWRQVMLARSQHRRYWAGIPEHLCFPWNEPDMALWNPVTLQEEPGWRVLPPELCLKNRAAAARPFAPLQIQPEGRGPLKPSPNVLFGRLANEIIVADMQSGRTYSLQNLAADIWDAIIACGNVPDVISRLAQRHVVPLDGLENDVVAFVRTLAQTGLLEESEQVPAVPLMATIIATS